MDEAEVWDDLVSDTTVDKFGLAAQADGTKLKPFIVFRGAKRETKL